MQKSTPESGGPTNESSGLAGKVRAAAASVPDPFFVRFGPDELLRRSATGGVISLGAQFVRLVLQIGSTMILARLLTPRDFGLVAMAVVFTGFLSVLRDLGLSAATVQSQQISQREATNLFWLGGAASLLTGCIGAASSPLVAWFYGEQALILLMVASSLTLAVGGIGAQHTALIRRRMQFGRLAVIETGALVVGISSAILVTIAGGGYWALIALTFFQSLTALVMSVLLSGWLPGLPRHGVAIGALVRFGSYITAFNVVNYLNRNIDNAILGRYFGAADLGIYSKAYALLLLPLQQINQPIASVAIPALSRLQNDPAGYRSYYLNLVRIMAYLSMPLAVLLGVLAGDIVAVVLGPQWHEAAAIFRIFAIFAVVQSVVSTSGWVLQSTGQSDRLFRWGVFHACVFIAACMIGVRWGVRGVAIAVTAQALAVSAPALAYALKGRSIAVTDVVRATLKPCLGSVALFLVTSLTLIATGAESVGTRTAAVLGSGLCLLALSFSLSTDLRAEARAVRDLLAGR